MEEKIDEILLANFKEGDWQEARKQLLLLFSVSCQRELFIAMIDKMKQLDWEEADNGFAGRVYDRLNGNK